MMNRTYVRKKATILRKLSGFNFNRRINSMTLKQLHGINGELDEKINRILNYERYGHDPVVQAALAKHGVLSIAKLPKK
ncbi:MAG: hypothetical protein KAV87_00245 [Desulfobacteraceae bacterium]|nr:hypothetical protein [Desulfobacteraceae bacterium]